MSDERGKKLTISQVAKRIDKGISSVYRIKESKEIPFFRGGPKKGFYTYEMYVENWKNEREEHPSW